MMSSRLTCLSGVTVIEACVQLRRKSGQQDNLQELQMQ
jgi:hypothetical protein